MLNDVRNNTEHMCVIVDSNGVIINDSDPTILNVTGEYIVYICMYGFYGHYKIFVPMLPLSI